jgi:hypothetical protein
MDGAKELQRSPKTQRERLAMVAHEEKYKFKVNDKEFEQDQPTLTGAQVRQIAEVPPAYQLFLEVHGGKKEDRLIGNGDVVDLTVPGIQKLYTVPPATFGRLWA